jgi:hypothetical protein
VEGLNSRERGGEIGGWERGDGRWEGTNWIRGEKREGEKFGIRKEGRRGVGRGGKEGRD